MKIALLNDSHFGARNDADVFLAHQQLFFEDVFFPMLKDNGITHILHLGDLFDRRKYINFKTLQRVEQFFFRQLVADNMTMDIIVGNHDVFFKDTNSVNSLNLLANKYSNINVYDTDAITKSYGGVDIALVPWITRDNKDQCMQHLKETHADIVAGHFDIVGFEYMPGVENHEGLTPKTFKRFDQVWSGHYHGKHSKGNIHYLGTQFELTWADCGYSKGFHIYDTDTNELTFVENPHKLFYKIYYNDTDGTDQYEGSLDHYADRYVKVIVTQKSNHFLFDRFIDRLHAVHPIDISIVEEIEKIEDDFVIEDTQDTMSILDTYIDQMENVSSDKNKIKKLIRELYTEALSVE